MKTSTEGFQQSYNSQTVVDDESQMVVEASVSACASDQGELIARLDAVEEHLGGRPAEVLADAGYCNEADLVELEAQGIAGYVALGRDDLYTEAVTAAASRSCRPSRPEVHCLRLVHRPVQWHAQP